MQKFENKDFAIVVRQGVSADLLTDATKGTCYRGEMLYCTDDRTLSIADADAGASLPNIIPVGSMVRRVAVSSSPYDADLSDYYVGVDTSSGAITVNLPASTSGKVIVVKDEGGNAGTNNITVVGTIDGGTNHTINVNYGTVSLIGDGSAWFKV
ncbi:hypothetical protein HED60_13825 [Planctomycetales bacterium ZRK34]|nr:hypothetical protein HED60_13825 [Planctomycetales bacterium ZRK34]